MVPVLIHTYSTHLIPRSDPPMLSVFLVPRLRGHIFLVIDHRVKSMIEDALRTHSRVERLPRLDGHLPTYINTACRNIDSGITTCKRQNIGALGSLLTYTPANLYTYMPIYLIDDAKTDATPFLLREGTRSNRCPSSCALISSIPSSMIAQITLQHELLSVYGFLSHLFSPPIVVVPVIDKVHMTIISMALKERRNNSSTGHKAQLRTRPHV
ncbi:hypothetical protein F5X99DRAFT_268624 [Biscogniauxia marginata]|nr:hypothetical protein F5X99DRAFT_268624 [Biscogniauxia marginata]